uniref:Putative secreted protein n=1 Tax=Anopheles darlingi TaxID=43151 RepID=A0A2M4DRA0_ANODA
MYVCLFVYLLLSRGSSKGLKQCCCCCCCCCDQTTSKGSNLRMEYGNEAMVRKCWKEFDFPICIVDHFLGFNGRIPSHSHPKTPPPKCHLHFLAIDFVLNMHLFEQTLRTTPE